MYASFYPAQLAHSENMFKELIETPTDSQIKQYSPTLVTADRLDSFGQTKNGADL